MSSPSISFSSVFLYAVVGFRERKEQTLLLGDHGLRGGRVSGLALLAAQGFCVLWWNTKWFSQRRMCQEVRQVLWRLQNAQDPSAQFKRKKTLQSLLVTSVWVNKHILSACCIPRHHAKQRRYGLQHVVESIKKLLGLNTFKHYSWVDTFLQPSWSVI